MLENNSVSENVEARVITDISNPAYRESGGTCVCSTYPSPSPNPPQIVKPFQYRVCRQMAKGIEPHVRLAGPPSTEHNTLIARTSSAARGLFARRAIPADTVLGEYTGVLRRRAEVYRGHVLHFTAVIASYRVQKGIGLHHLTVQLDEAELPGQNNEYCAELHLCTDVGMCLCTPDMEVEQACLSRCTVSIVVSILQLI